MTTYEKFKQEVDAVPFDDPRRDLLRRMLDKIDGQAISYRKLQDKYAELVDKLKEKKGELSLQAYKALCLERMLVRLYAYGEIMKEDGYREWAMNEMQPYLTASRYDFEHQRSGVDE